MPDGVHPSVQSVQPAALEAARDAVRADAGGEQLSLGDDAVLV
jgi:hypothetical protein